MAVIACVPSARPDTGRLAVRLPSGPDVSWTLPRVVTAPPKLSLNVTQPVGCCPLPLGATTVTVAVRFTHPNTTPGFGVACTDVVVLAWFTDSEYGSDSLLAQV